MAKKDTDLLNDPLNVAKTRYREQIDAFKNQYFSKPNNKEKLKVLTDFDFSKDEITQIMKRKI
jgi:hypothetical protein